MVRLGELTHAPGIAPSNQREVRPAPATPAVGTPATASSALVHVRRLQAAAGNRAVARLLQRQPAAPQGTPPTTVSVDIPIATRLADAAAAVKRSEIDEAAWTVWRTEGGKLNNIAFKIWLNELFLPDVDPATLKSEAAAIRSDRTKRQEYKAKVTEATLAASLEKDLRARVRTAITAKLDTALVLGRIIEPICKVDTIRVLTEIGVTAPSRATFRRCLQRSVERDYRTTVSEACYAHTTRGGGLALVLYDLTTLYFETPRVDALRKVSMSKERRVDPQVTVGLLTDNAGFPWLCTCSRATRRN
jgi:hypothetical protein